MGMVVDYTWTILFAAAAVLSLRFAWHTPVRPISYALIGSIAFSFVTMQILPDKWVPLEPAVFAIAEIGVMGVAMFCLSAAPYHAAAIMVLNLTSCIVSLAYPGYQHDVSLIVYEEIVNTILGLECFVQINVGLWRDAGIRIGRYLRLRRHRRNAMHALLRFRVASNSSKPDERERFTKR